MNKNFLDNKSFLISSIELKEVKLEEDVEKEFGKFYTLEVNVKANKNFVNSVDSCFIYRGNKDSILKVMTEELFFDEVFKFFKTPIELSQECCDFYKNILDQFLNFELSKEQLKLLELGESKGYKLYPHYFINYTPEKEMLYFGYKLCSKDLCIIISAEKKHNYSVFVSDRNIIKSLHHLLIGCDFKTLELFIEKDELPINQSLDLFKEFLELNKEIIDGRIIEDFDRPSTFKVYKRNYREKTKKLLLTFDFDTFKLTGFNLKTLLIGLLGCEFAVLNKSIELENTFKKSDCLSCSCTLNI